MAENDDAITLVQEGDRDDPRWRNMDAYVRKLIPEPLQFTFFEVNSFEYCDSKKNPCHRDCARLGKGSYGSVYRMKPKVGRGAVAVKQVRHRPEDLLGEVRVLCNLERHPNVIRIKGMITEGGRCWVVLPIARASLDKVIVEERTIADPQFLKFARRVLQILLGVEHLQKGSKIIVHRDVKPGNILQFLSRETNQETLVLADFGLASISDNTATGKAWQGGTPAYQSPEQRDRTVKIGPQSDVFSVGATMYHMLTGKPPPQVEERQPLPRVEHAPPAIQRLVAECCAFDPKTRPDIQTCIRQVRRFIRITERPYRSVDDVMREHQQDELRDRTLSRLLQICDDHDDSPALDAFSLAALILFNRDNHSKAIDMELLFNAIDLARRYLKQRWQNPNYAELSVMAVVLRLLGLDHPNGDDNSCVAFINTVGLVAAAPDVWGAALSRGEACFSRAVSGTQPDVAKRAVECLAVTLILLGLRVEVDSVLHEHQVSVWSELLASREVVVSEVASRVRCIENTVELCFSLPTTVRV